MSPKLSYRPRRFGSWKLRFALGALLLGGGLAWWLRWGPLNHDRIDQLLSLRKTPADAANTNGPAPAGRGGTNSATRPGTPAWPPTLQTSAPPPVIRHVPNPSFTRSDNPNPEWPARPPRSMLEAQIALARLGLSPGSVDGFFGPKTAAALRAFQQRAGLPATGQLDPATKRALLLTEPPFTQHVVTTTDISRPHPVGATWLEKSRQSSLDYESLIELVAEKWQADPDLIKQLNQDLDWASLGAGTSLVVPNIRSPEFADRAAWVRIRLNDRVLEAYDDATNLMVRFPCSIARNVEKRPVGTLHVTLVAPDPNYTYDPALFPLSAEARTLTNKLVLPPGPNCPVGTAWIGLDRPGYGIHGTPNPEKVGEAESLGCFRLANWNAELLLRLAWVGMPVVVQP